MTVRGRDQSQTDSIGRKADAKEILGHARAGGGDDDAGWGDILAWFGVQPIAHPDCGSQCCYVSGIAGQEVPLINPGAWGVPGKLGGGLGGCSWIFSVIYADEGYLVVLPWAQRQGGYCLSHAVQLGVAQVGATEVAEGQEQWLPIVQLGQAERAAVGVTEDQIAWQGLADALVDAGAAIEVWRGWRRARQRSIRRVALLLRG